MNSTSDKYLAMKLMSSSPGWEMISFASPYLFSVLGLWILTEQISYLRKKSILPGPTLILPFIGSVTSLIRDPTRFWSNQTNYARRTPLGVSSNYVIGQFMVFIHSTELSHKVFANVRPDAFDLIGHPFGKKLFGEHNLIYMSGQEHKDMRRRIAPNFTPRALSTYAKIQQRIILQHLTAWERLSKGKPIPLRILAREMNLETSQTVFAGPYLRDETRKRFNHDYNLFNVGLMKLPLDLPGFAFRSARLAVSRLVDTLTVCVEESKVNITSSGMTEPTCLIDFWMQDALREEKQASAAGTTPSPPLPTTNEIGGHLFDFLFAAQDASTSSLLWAVTYLDSHPDVLAKVRGEVAAIWSPGGDYLTAEQLASLSYTQAVAREVLRIRPPATLVTHIAANDFPLTENYTIPKGAIVFPSVLDSSFQGFTDPDRFEPERFLDEEKIYKRNFLVFGAGAHQCVGQRYATNHLVLFIALFTAVLDFQRYRTDGCDDIVYVPTISPKDDCFVSLSIRRLAPAPYPHY